MKLSSIIFEGFREDVSIVNGEKYSVDWLGTADTLLDFQDALKRMPETIEYINIPTDDRLFNPSAKRIKPKGSWKLEVYATVKKVIDMHEKEGNELEGIRISSYYGIGPKGADDHPIYVSIDTKESREFGQAMSRGDYGPLD
jgi:hypothetical protein|tara:strand:+ start:405 stop:830 length:426 start_codon:yes stop_codon:yes gene_type:complete